MDGRLASIFAWITSQPSSNTHCAPPSPPSSDSRWLLLVFGFFFLFFDILFWIWGKCFDLVYCILNQLLYIYNDGYFSIYAFWTMIGHEHLYLFPQISFHGYSWFRV